MGGYSGGWVGSGDEAKARADPRVSGHGISNVHVQPVKASGDKAWLIKGRLCPVLHGRGEIRNGNGENVDW